MKTSGTPKIYSKTEEVDWIRIEGFDFPLSELFNTLRELEDAASGPPGQYCLLDQPIRGVLEARGVCFTNNQGSTYRGKNLDDFTQYISGLCEEN